MLPKRCDTLQPHNKNEKRYNKKIGAHVFFKYFFHGDRRIANNIYGKIRGIIYRPFSADCKGNPCIEVGDAVRLPTKYEIIEIEKFA